VQKKQDLGTPSVVRSPNPKPTIDVSMKSLETSAEARTPKTPMQLLITGNRIGSRSPTTPKMLVSQMTPRSPSREALNDHEDSLVRKDSEEETIWESDLEDEEREEDQGTVIDVGFVSFGCCLPFYFFVFARGSKRLTNLVSAQINTER